MKGVVPVGAQFHGRRITGGRRKIP